MEGQERKERRQPRHSAEQKAQAVLAVWTERGKPLEVCRELGIAWTILDQWQKRAMEGMLQALEPRAVLERGSALSPRLQALLARRRKASATERTPRRTPRAAAKETEGKEE